MKYLPSILLVLSWVVCVNCLMDTTRPSDCPSLPLGKQALLEGYCLNGATCKVEYGQAVCWCTEGWKGDQCDEDASNDPPLTSLPEGYTLVAPVGMCSRTTQCGLGTSQSYASVMAMGNWFYQLVTLACCCTRCTGGTGAGGIPPAHSCKDVFPNLGNEPFNTMDSQMCHSYDIES